MVKVSAVHVESLASIVIAGAVLYVLIRGPKGAILDVANLGASLFKGAAQVVGVPDPAEAVSKSACCAAIADYADHPFTAPWAISWHCSAPDYLRWASGQGRPAFCKG